MDFIVDDRERAMFPHIENIKLKHVKQRLSIGDYIIKSQNNELLACIERKTLDDYGASIRDGRKYENFDKMFSLRARLPHLQLYLIVEGGRKITAVDETKTPKVFIVPPDPETAFSGIKYKGIITSATNLMIERDVYVIYTTSREDTAEKLAKLVDTFAKKRPNIQYSAFKDFATSEELRIKYDINPAAEMAALSTSTIDERFKTEALSIREKAAEDNYDTKNNSDIKNNDVIKNNDDININTMVGGNFVRSDLEEAARCLIKLKGISKDTAHLILRTHTIIEAISAPHEISNIVRDSGRKLGKSVFAAIDISKDDVKFETLLTGITGITTNSLKGSVKFEMLLENNVNKLGLLGKTRTDRAISILNTKK